MDRHCRPTVWRILVHDCIVFPRCAEVSWHLNLVARPSNRIDRDDCRGVQSIRQNHRFSRPGAQGIRDISAHRLHDVLPEGRMEKVNRGNLCGSKFDCVTVDRLNTATDLFGVQVSTDILLRNRMYRSWGNSTPRMTSNRDSETTNKTRPLPETQSTN